MPWSACAAVVAPRSPDLAGTVAATATAALRSYLHPVTGGPAGTGWPFGRPVRLSDVAALLERLEDLDHVAELVLMVGGAPQGESVSVPPDAARRGGHHGCRAGAGRLVPLPLPNLDTRRWADLIDEGRALIPRYAPGWTDHNVHDPGVTLLELLAWLVEQDVYRANRIPERHLRKFLTLAGIGCEPPRCARIALSFTLAPGTGAVDLPRGTTFAGAVGTSTPVRFRTMRRVRVAPAAIAAVQTWNGTAYVDVTRLWRDGLPFAALGSEPVGFDEDQPPALLLGLDGPLPVGEHVWLWLAEAGVAGPVLGVRPHPGRDGGAGRGVPPPVAAGPVRRRLGGTRRGPRRGL